VIVGLRVDVDTLRGHTVGVPSLYRVFEEFGIRASFFFSVGPDNMGRHLYRLLKPQFLWKMLRTSAPSLYGWDIILRGTVWPGPIIGKSNPEILRGCTKRGHELGLHAWDHHEWQARLENMPAEVIQRRLGQAFDLISEVAGEIPTCSAAPSWRITDEALIVKEEFPFRYNSDCRGDGPFLPLVGEKVLRQPQIPNVLPTYDELVGQNGITDRNYNERLISLIVEQQQMAVLTIHAEVEGVAKRDLFRNFLEESRARGISFCRLVELLPASREALPIARIQRKIVSGREGWISEMQGTRVALDSAIGNH